MIDHINPWIPLTPLEQMEQTEYDVLIVGTGAGGGAVLWRLCQQWRGTGKRIGIIDAGGLLLPTHAMNLPTINNFASVNEIYLKPPVVEPAGIQPSGLPGAVVMYAVGGKTLLWRGVSPRMLTTRVSRWPVPLNELNAYYNVAEEAMNVNRELPSGYLKLFTETVLNRLRSHGLIQAERTPLARSLATGDTGIINSTVYFSPINFLGNALNLRSFQLAIQARAAKVICTQGKIEGVEVVSPSKKLHFLRSKVVVLSAGTFESPRILLNSGIPGKAIGHYLTFHSNIVLPGIFHTAVVPEMLGASVAPSASIPETDKRPFRLGWVPVPSRSRPLQNELAVLMASYGTVESRFENRVALDPNIRDAYGIPEIRIYFSYSEQDYAVMRQIPPVMLQAAEAAGMSIEYTNGRPAFSLSPPGRDFHSSCTCRMGDNPNEATTNRFGEVFGVSGLFVADNSVLPTLPASNPTLTTVALAIRTADYIAGFLHSDRRT